MNYVIDVHANYRCQNTVDVMITVITYLQQSRLKLGQAKISTSLTMSNISDNLSILHLTNIETRLKTDFHHYAME